ncbi:DUF1828 domain-containing protein [Companilactobacillus ginsenosidimutans]|nr:DUF1828 domain-containing protein [Companilactobacillus ginsenosidimutans]
MNWINEYTDWINKKCILNKFDGGDEIVTPFTNIIGDRIPIYVTVLSMERIRISDDGETLSNLILSGIRIENNAREKTLNSILKSFNIKKSNQNILELEGSSKDFASMSQKMIQAILRIDDLAMTRKSTINKMFNDKVINYFNEQEFGGLPNYRISGGSGNSYKVSYGLGKTKKHPVRLIQIINNPDFQRISTEIVTHNDVNNSSDFTNQNNTYIIIFNDSNSKISDKSNNVAIANGLKLIPWSNKEAIIDLR